MVLFNYAIREITAKIVYYGPGLCGKTTNLQFVHEKLDPGSRGKLLSLATDGDRTLFFDFLPIEMGNINGYKVRFQLYTVPGQVHYNATRKLVLKGVDAVVFVADSQLSMVERNRESFDNLVENLAENGYELARVPVVIQLNKRDLPNIASPGELVASMGVEGFPVLEAVAYRGDGVFETLKACVKLTLTRLKSQFEAEAGGGRDLRERPAAPPAPPPAPPPPPAEVFAPAPPAPHAWAPVERPAVPRAPEPLAAAPQPAPVESYDEFDLEEYREINPEPVAAPEAPPHEAEPDAVALDEGFEVLTEDDLSEHEPWPVGEGAGAAPEPAEPGLPPPWALEMMEELRRLRDENRDLRSALRGVAGVLERQVAVLQQGREQLEVAVGRDDGPVDEEAAAP